MGNILEICRCCNKNSLDNAITILLAGLDNAGKTRTVGLLVGSNSNSEAPTVGFQPSQLKYCGRVVHLHDVGGSDQFRRAWHHYFADAFGLIFVVDSADRDRLHECGQVLEEVLAHPHISGKPVLILANKQDLKDAMDDLDIVERLNIEIIVNRYKCPTRVESYTTVMAKGKNTKHHIDPGLKKGYEWLLNYIIHEYDALKLRVKNDMSDQKQQQFDNSDNHINNIESVTGFYNPNYKIDMIQEEIENKEGIITVKQASFEKTDIVNGDIKLSPLFGGKNEVKTSNQNSIELEARTQMRKLSPITKHKIFTAPSLEILNLPKSNANEIFAQQLRSFKSQDSLDTHINESQSSIRNLSSKSKVSQVSLSDTIENNGALSSAKLELNRKVLPPIKGFIPKNVMSPERVIRLSTHDPSVERPKSASESVKEQLENINHSDNRKKVITKGLHRNRISPEENTNLFSYNPNLSCESSNGEFPGNLQNKSKVDVVM